MVKINFPIKVNEKILLCQFVTMLSIFLITGYSKVVQRATYRIYLQLQQRLMASRLNWPCDKVDSCSNRRSLAVPCSLADAP